MSVSVEIDRVDEDRWNHLLAGFDDATIFQSWAYGSARWGRSQLSHAVIREDGEAVALAQVTLLGVPLYGKVLAHVAFGPVWRRCAAPGRIDHLGLAVRALRQEYAVRRHMCVRVRPPGHDRAVEIRSVMSGESGWREMGSPYTTCILDLSRPEEEIRRAMDKRWRANLQKAERAGLMISWERGGEGVRIFSELSGQMQRRKRFSSDFVGTLPALYEALPQAFKPEIAVCRREGMPVAAAIISAIGECAFYLHGASSQSALEVRAGYLLQWAAVRRLKEQGRCRWYDLYGVLVNPGVRQFKKGLVGVGAPEIMMSEYQACESRLLASVMDAALWLRKARRGIGRRPVSAASAS